MPSLPLDPEVGGDRLPGPTGESDEGSGLLVVADGEEVCAAGRDRRALDPEADHLAPVEPEGVPLLPERARITGPGGAAGHAEEHAPPGVTPLLQHLHHQPEVDAQHFDQPAITRIPAVVVEVLAEPEPVDVGEVLQVEVGAGGEAVPLVVLVGRMEIDHRRSALAFQNSSMNTHSAIAPETTIQGSSRRPSSRRA